MIDDADQARAGAGPDGQPRRSRLGRILAEQPEARPRLRRAIGGMLATVLASIVVLGLLAIWHLRRRAQLIRDSLAPPRRVPLTDPHASLPTERTDD